MQETWRDGGAGHQPNATHVRFKCIPKLGIIFNDNCPFYGNVDGICNNRNSVCYMVPVRMTNI
nr:beta-defensin 50-like [Meriones unguiculatus]